MYICIYVPISVSIYIYMYVYVWPSVICACFEVCQSADCRDEEMSLATQRAALSQRSIGKIESASYIYISIYRDLYTYIYRYMYIHTYTYATMYKRT